MKKIVFFLIFMVSFPIIISVIYLLLNMIGYAVSYLVLISIVAIVLIVWYGVSKMRSDYKQISTSQKSNYWTIVTNTFLVLFTFWMGIFVQDLIARKNSSINDKLVKIQYVDNMLPDMKALWSNEVFSNSKELLWLGKSYDDKIVSLQDSLKAFPESSDSINELIRSAQKDSAYYVEKYSQYLLDNKYEVLSFARTIDSTMNKYSYYATDNSLADSIKASSLRMRVCMYTAELLNDSTLLDKVFFAKVDSLSKESRIRAFYAHRFSSPEHQLSAGIQGDLILTAELGYSFYKLALDDPSSLYNRMMKECVKNCIYMECLMIGKSINQDIDFQDAIYDFFLERVLKNPISTFLITILLSILVCALLSRFISPSSTANKDNLIRSLENKIKNYEQQIQNNNRTSDNAEHKILAKNIEINELRQKIDLLQLQLDERNNTINKQLTLLTSIVQHNDPDIEQIENEKSIVEGLNNHIDPLSE